MTKGAGIPLQGMHPSGSWHTASSPAFTPTMGWKLAVCAGPFGESAKNSLPSEALFFSPPNASSKRKLAQGTEPLQPLLSVPKLVILLGEATHRDKSILGYFCAQHCADWCSKSGRSVHVSWCPAPHRESKLGASVLRKGMLQQKAPAFHGTQPSPSVSCP